MSSHHQRNNIGAQGKNEAEMKQGQQQSENSYGENAHLVRLSKSSLIAQKSNDSLPIVIQHHLANHHHHLLSNYHQQQLRQIYNVKNANSVGTTSNPTVDSSSSPNQNIITNKYFLNKEEVIISIEGFRFQPSSLYVHTGTKLVWQVKTNKPIYNTLYDSTGPRFFIVSIPQLEEESPPIHENESYSFIVGQIGQFDMICPNYTRMKGALVVVDKSITLADLTKELQPKGCFMEHVDEFKYASQNLHPLNLTQQQQQQLSLSNQSTQIFQQSEASSLMLGGNIETNGRNSKYNPLGVYYNDNIVSSQNSHNNSLTNINHNHQTASTQSSSSSSHPNIQKNKLYYQMSNSAVLQQKSEAKNDSSINSENARKNSSDQLSLANSPSLTLFQSNQDVNEKNITQDSTKQQQFSKQEKILTKIIDSNHTETAESEKIAKQFMQELQDEQNNLPNKKKNAHYLQLYKDDFQEDIDEDEEEQQETNQSIKKKKFESENKKNSTLPSNSKSKQSIHTQSNEYSNSQTNGNNQKRIEDNIKQSTKSQNKLVFAVQSSSIEQQRSKEDILDRGTQYQNLKDRKAQKTEKELTAIEQALLTPKKKVVSKKDMLVSQQLKKMNNNNFCNSSSSSHQSSSYQQISTIKEEENDITQESKKNSQLNPKGVRLQQDSQQNEMSFEKQLDESSQTYSASSSTITSNPTTLANDEKRAIQSQELIVQFNSKNKTSLQQQNNQVKQIKKFNTIHQQKQSSETQNGAQKEQNDQEQKKSGYHSDYDCAQNEDEDDDEVNIERRKNVLLLKQGGNAANNLYFRGHNFQSLRHYQNQYGSMGIANEDDEYDDDGEEDDCQYDCNTIISEEDASAYTSKENSLVYRRNNSSSNLHTSGSGMIGSNDKPNNSFTASQTLNKRFTKRIRRNYRKKPKIGGLSESYLKSPAQSILTTAESSKYSDTTKQLSQKGDFELEGNDMHERGGLLFQHKYSQKRRASTDQTIQESRYHNNNNNEDSDTRSIKSLKNEPNIINSSNINNNGSNCTNLNNVCGSGFGCTGSTCNGNGYTQNGGNQNVFDCCSEGNNESECPGLLQKCYQNTFVKGNHDGQAGQFCCNHTRSTNIFDFIKKQTKLSFLNFTENIEKQHKCKSILKNSKQGGNYISSNQSSGSLEGLSEKREESKSFSSQNTNNMSPQTTDEQQNIKLIENYNQNSSNIQNEVNFIQNNIQHTNEKDESIQEQIQFVHSLLEQRYEIESWLISVSEDIGEIEDY